MQVWELRLQTTARWLTVALPVLLITGRAAADTALSLAAILFFIRCIATGDWSWTRRTWVRVALGLWVWMLLISNFAYEVGPSYTEAVAWIRFVLFAAAAEGWILNQVWIRRLIYATGAALLFTASDAILQYVTGHDLFHYPKYSANRLTGPFSPHPEVGVYMMRLFFPALLGGLAVAISRSVGTLWRVAVAACAALVVTAIFLSGERAALLLTLFGLILLVLLRRGPRRALIALGTLAILVAVLVAVKPPIVQRQVDSTAAVLSDFRNSNYGQLWQSGLMMGRESPLTGVGMHNFRYVCVEPGKHFPRCNLHPHNMYIQWFAESGIPGLVGFVILVGVWLSRFWRAVRQSGGSGWILGPALAVFVQLWPIAPTGSFFSNWNAVTFWLVLGWGLASVRFHSQAVETPVRSIASPQMSQ